MPFLIKQVPTVVWFGILAFVLTVVAGGVWTLLLIGNLATSPAIPWAVVVMALLLWLMWRYLSGTWGPASTSQTRRRSLRARPLPPQVFAWAVVAGVLSIVALIGSWIVLVQLVRVPPHVLPNGSQYPLLTLTLVLVMASLVSSLAEEAGFRGYFQGLLEQRVSGLLAIVIAALVIAPAHGLTQGFVWPVLVWYFFVDVMLGAMAYFTQSILPGILVHSLGLLIFFTLVWPQDAQRRLVWQGGATPGFWLTLAQALVFSPLAILAFSQLARVSKRARDLESKSLLPPSVDEPGG